MAPADAADGQRAGTANDDDAAAASASQLVEELLAQSGALPPLPVPSQQDAPPPSGQPLPEEPASPVVRAPDASAPAVAHAAAAAAPAPAPAPDGPAAVPSGASGGASPASAPAPDRAPSATGRAAAAPAADASSRMPGGMPVISFDSVSKVYPAQPNKPALSNVSLKIYAGEFIFLVGHSGSGKSTFIRLINREIVATRGRLAVAGEDVIRMRNWRVPYLRRNIGCVFQDFKLLPNKTAFDNVAFALEVIGKSKHIIRTQVPEVLRLVGLEDRVDQYPDQLSGGEQQRVSIARAIVNRPPLLICDEPTGNLDPQTSLGIMRLLDRINRTGTTILVATHDREMVDSLRKRVVALENGYLVRDQDKGVYGADA
jgi:cell division transport system ATP-binding protein